MDTFSCYTSQRLSLSHLKSTLTLPVFSTQRSQLTQRDPGAHISLICCFRERLLLCFYSLAVDTHALLLLYYVFKWLMGAHAQYSLNTQLSFASTGHTFDLVLHAKHSNIQALLLAYTLERQRFHTCDFESG